jgi:hypothetical protein
MALPQRALTNHELDHFAQDVPYFRGVFMRNALPPKPRWNESAIINLDDKDGPGTHWVAYKKRGRFVTYFDSYGNLPPPKELAAYLCKTGRASIIYNTDRYQHYNQYNCGHLCLQFLYSSSNPATTL